MYLVVLRSRDDTSEASIRELTGSVKISPGGADGRGGLETEPQIMISSHPWQTEYPMASSEGWPTVVLSVVKMRLLRRRPASLECILSLAIVSEIERMRGKVAC